MLTLFNLELNIMTDASMPQSAVVTMGKFEMEVLMLPNGEYRLSHEQAAKVIGFKKVIRYMVV
jgi:hypothetical protein